MQGTVRYLNRVDINARELSRRFINLHVEWLEKVTRGRIERCPIRW